MLKTNKLMAVAVFFIAVLSFTALFADFIAPFPYEYQDTKALLQAPSAPHYFGTDRLGRDILSRIIYGARISLTVAIISSAIAVLFGAVYGACAGFIGGKTESAMMRFVDIVYCIPDLLIIILISIMIGRGITGITLSLSLVSWVTVARVMRGEVIRIKVQDFVEAAKTIGAGKTRIIFLHIFPGALTSLIITATFRIPQVILAESSLSFLGLGVPPPFSSWGTLANEGWASLRFYPHLILFPAVVIFISITAFNLIGEGLRDILDPYRKD